MGCRRVARDHIQRRLSGDCESPITRVTDNEPFLFQSRFEPRPSQFVYWRACRISCLLAWPSTCLSLISELILVSEEAPCSKATCDLARLRIESP